MALREPNPYTGTERSTTPPFGFNSLDLNGLSQAYSEKSIGNELQGGLDLNSVTGKGTGLAGSTIGNLPAEQQYSPTMMQKTPTMSGLSQGPTVSNPEFPQMKEDNFTGSVAGMSGKEDSLGGISDSSGGKNRLTSEQQGNMQAGIALADMTVQGADQAFDKAPEKTSYGNIAAMSVKGAASGAAAGAALGPWGAAIGASIGGTVGAVKGVVQKKKEGREAKTRKLEKAKAIGAGRTQSLEVGGEIEGDSHKEGGEMINVEGGERILSINDDNSMMKLVGAGKYKQAGEKYAKIIKKHETQKKEYVDENGTEMAENGTQVQETGRYTPLLSEQSTTLADVGRELESKLVLGSVPVGEYIPSTPVERPIPKAEHGIKIQEGEIAEYKGVQYQVMPNGEWKSFTGGNLNVPSKEIQAEISKSWEAKAKQKDKELNPPVTNKKEVKAEVSRVKSDLRKGLLSRDEVSQRIKELESEVENFSNSSELKAIKEDVFDPWYKFWDSSELNKDQQSLSGNTEKLSQVMGNDIEGLYNKKISEIEDLIASTNDVVRGRELDKELKIINKQFRKEKTMWNKGDTRGFVIDNKESYNKSLNNFYKATGKPEEEAQTLSTEQAKALISKTDFGGPDSTTSSPGGTSTPGTTEATTDSTPEDTRMKDLQANVKSFVDIQKGKSPDYTFDKYTQESTDKSALENSADFLKNNAIDLAIGMEALRGASKDLPNYKIPQQVFDQMGRLRRLADQPLTTAELTKIETDAKSAATGGLNNLAQSGLSSRQLLSVTPMLSKQLADTNLNTNIAELQLKRQFESDYDQSVNRYLSLDQQNFNRDYNEAFRSKTAASSLLGSSISGIRDTQFFEKNYGDGSLYDQGQKATIADTTENINQLRESRASFVANAKQDQSMIPLSRLTEELKNADVKDYAALSDKFELIKQQY